MTFSNLQVIRNVYKETGSAYCITIRAMCTFVFLRITICLNNTERVDDFRVTSERLFLSLIAIITVDSLRCGRNARSLLVSPVLRHMSKHVHE